jgi:uncharacterized short protein YbdD (DUF466 family)
MLRMERCKGIINCQLRIASSTMVNQGRKSSMRQSPIMNILRQATQLLIGAFSYPEYPFILTILRQATQLLIGAFSYPEYPFILTILRQATQLLIGAFSYHEYPFILTIQIQTLSRDRLRRLKCILSLRLLQLTRLRSPPPCSLRRLSSRSLAPLRSAFWPDLSSL